ncbi:MULTISPECIES: NAD(P)-dependent oxidoreductase [Enterococcus]|uniref:NAD(P)-dependent oxidoreductase n=1 Tax=Enterococcus TaxID=1350 RepID=UPI000A357146|nr:MULTISPECIES: NAD(P)H-binding protein [unclassified Enterococcus]
MNITIFGGSGFIGQKLIEELTNRGHDLTSISRHGKPTDLSSSWSEKVHWVRSDILNDTNWHKAIQQADWVIDTIGILFEHPRKGITYDRFILSPVQLILDYLSTHNPTAHFLFISANSAPFPLRNYMNAKLQAEQLIKASSLQYVIIYPSLVVDKKRYFSVISAFGINLLKAIPGIRKLVHGYEPISRETLAAEIANVIEGETSAYTQRQT